MLDNRRVTSLFASMLAAAGYSLPVSVLVAYLSDLAYQSDAPGIFNGLAVFTVLFAVIGTAFAHWRAAERIAWDVAHRQPVYNVTVQGGERMIPELGADDKPIYHKRAQSNASTFETAAAVRAIEPRKLVRPHIPEFVTVTQVTALAYAALGGEKLTIRTWAGKGKPFSDPQWRQLKAWMIQRGFWDCKDDRPNSAIVMTDSGCAWMKSITVAYPPPLRTYRYKA